MDLMAAGDVLAAPSELVALQLPMAVNVIAVAVGAIVGTLKAGEYDDIDVVGMFVLALCLGFGGSIMRDILLGHLPPVTFRTPIYLVTVLAAVVVASFFLAYLAHLEKPLWLLDTVSIGLFAAVGTNAAALAGLGFLPAVLVGTVQAIGGGILVDSLLGRPSSVLFRGPMNVLAGLAGAAVYALLFDLVEDVIATSLAVGATFGLRVLGRVGHVQSPMPIKEHYGLRAKVIEPLVHPRIGLRRRMRGVWARFGAISPPDDLPEGLRLNTPLGPGGGPPSARPGRTRRSTAPRRAARGRRHDRRGRRARRASRPAQSPAPPP